MEINRWSFRGSKSALGNNRKSNRGRNRRKESEALSVAAAWVKKMGYNRGRTDVKDQVVFLGGRCSM
jgi:hypothetical protein